jgi:hypothetical protein
VYAQSKSRGKLSAMATATVKGKVKVKATALVKELPARE